MEFTTDFNYFTRWNDIAFQRVSPDQDEQELMDIIKSALDEGWFYQSDVVNYVKEKADFIPVEVHNLQNGTVDGLMGTLVYSARKTVGIITEREVNIKALEKYNVGDVLGTISVRGKRYFKATIKEIDGEAIVCEMSTGKYRYRYQITASNVQQCIDHAIQRGWRKE